MNNSSADYKQNNESRKAGFFHVISFCHQRHGRCSLCVYLCSLSCHTVIKHFVLNLIEAYIYKATLLYFGEPKSLRSHEITKKLQYISITSLYP